MLVHDLTGAEVVGLAAAVRGFTDQRWSIADPACYRAAVVAAHTLPLPLREALSDFKLRERAGAMLVRGIPIADIGPTPKHWEEPLADAPPTAEEAALVLIAALLGDLFGWSTQQDGRMIHNVLPIRDHQDEQLGSGSRQLLWWHTEDAFHEHRADYVLLLCLRNPDRVPTTYVDASAVPIADADRALLRQPAFHIAPDNSHLPGYAGSGGPVGAPSGAAADVDGPAAPSPVAVLFGDPADPYVRLDPYFMREPVDPGHRQALARLRHQIDCATQEVVLQPGDCLVLDNYRAVHGRAPFTARFDGQDRWPKRVNVTRDLRRSRALRHGVEERILYG